ncbi:MAG: hypothetical protein Q4C95_09575 [Planctomycetia bacterium]|nr:hypothetical protein [Planctomycetia bacterium]
MNNQSSFSMRTKIGLITIVLFIGILIGAWRSYQNGTSDDPISEACNRIGIMMFILWVAWPELVRLPRWFYISIPIIMAIAAWRPMILIYACPLLLLYWFLLPNKKSKKK